MGSLDWNPEITKHNQRIYRERQAAKSKTPQARNEPMQLFPMLPAPKLTAQQAKVAWLLENILEQSSLNLLFGEPGAGKSLFALEWAFCIASGLSWNGYRTKQADVVIIAGEGFAGLARRLKALECKHQCPAPERLYISQRPADFIDPVNINWLADSLKIICPNAGLVIIDTMHRNMSGDENSSQDIGKFINNIDLYLKPLGAAVLIVHHSGHGVKDRSRGSSSIRAAMDGEYSATKADNCITLVCHKAKDFEALKPLSFALKPIPLADWADDDGEPLTSVYLEHQGETTHTTKRRRLSARDDAILTSLADAITAHGKEPTAEIKAKYGGFDSFIGRMQKIVHIDHWRDKAYQVMTVDCESEDSKPQALKKAFQRGRDKLHNDGYVILHGDYAWRIFEQVNQGDNGTARDKTGHLSPDST